MDSKPIFDHDHSIEDFPEFVIETKVHGPLPSNEEFSLLSSMPSSGLGTVFPPPNSSEDDGFSSFTMYVIFSCTVVCVYEYLYRFLLGFFLVFPWIFSLIYVKATSVPSRIFAWLSLLFLVGVLVIFSFHYILRDDD